jgi:hypothetical protein
MMATSMPVMPRHDNVSDKKIGRETLKQFHNFLSIEYPSRLEARVVQDNPRVWAITCSSSATMTLRFGAAPVGVSFIQSFSTKRRKAVSIASIA